jgi:formylglycine-generating enzyme required for sulfatase activity
VAAQKGDKPPGLVLIKGGRTKVGNDVKDVEKMINEDLTVRTKVRTLDSTTPQISVLIEPFYMGLTEVTNEQFLEYVNATGTKPPHYWAGEAVEAQRVAFVTDKANKGNKFDSAEWWTQNWQEQKWDAPTGIDLLRPVNYVNYTDALAYCAWAGVRLPTEQEFQRACRGNSEMLYPWGEEWEDGKYAATSEMRSVKAAFPAGYFPAGASGEGLLDLAGNVWEWTTSNYNSYKGWKTGNVYNIGKGRRAEKLTPESSWSPSNQVVVGGGYVSDRVAAMCTIRRSTERTQKSQGMGFRVSASPKAGSDLANSIYQENLRHSRARGEGVLFELNGAVSVNHWSSKSTVVTDKDVKKERALKDYTIPSEYRVITGFEHMMFVSRDELPESGSDVLLSRATLREAQQIGFLSLSKPMVEPALEAGVYLVAYRAKGKFIEPKAETADSDAAAADAAAPDPDEPEPTDPFEGLIDFEEPNILILDSDSGDLVAHFPLKVAPTIKKGKGGGSYTQVETKRWIKDDAGEDFQLIEQWLDLAVEIPTSQSRRYLPLTLRMKPADGFFDVGWKIKQGK